MRTIRCSAGNQLFCRAPIYGHSSSAIIKALKAAIEDSECGSGLTLHQRQFGDLLDVPRTTIGEWLSGDQTGQIKRFIYGLERLSEPDRQKFFGRICRFFPRLDDERISHDRRAMETIDALLQQATGLVVTTANSEWARTFLVTAIAQKVALRGAVSGIDIHQPAKFVPAPGVYYPARRLSLAEQRSGICQVWPAIAADDSTLLMLNGVLRFVPRLAHDIIKVASRRLVLVADFPGKCISGAICPVTEIKIETEAANRWRLRFAHHACT